MNIFLELIDNDIHPAYINILEISHIYHNKEFNETHILFKNSEELRTNLSTKEVMKKVNLAFNLFENKEIVKKVTRAQLIDLED